MVGTNNSVLIGSHVVFLRILDKNDPDIELFSISFIVDILPGDLGENDDLGVVGLINSKPELTIPPPDG